MSQNTTTSLDNFRQTARAWLEENCPQSMRMPMVDAERVWAAKDIVFPNQDAKLWLERMAAKGWCAPQWPQEYGGGGLNNDEARVLHQEIKTMGCRDSQYSFGLTMVGPVVLEFGTEAQKKEFIPSIINGTLRWCQGFSEPGAGSDLAALRTAAVDKGDHYLVSGSKIWNSHADHADWVYCLVRTDPKASKQSGISFLLFNMRQPGITVKKIKMISGDSEFCEIFFDNARAEKAHRLGAENAGWTVAKRLLMHERVLMANLSEASNSSVEAEDIAKHFGYMDKKGKILDADIRTRMVDLLMERHAVNYTNARADAEIKSGVVAHTAMVLKYAGTEYEKRSSQLMIDLMGSAGIGWQGDTYETEALRQTKRWLMSFAYTIAGGSSEIQLNIIAKRALGLS